MEGKLQEKEFKIIMLKNQLKQLPTNFNMTGVLTPGGPGSHHPSMVKVQS
jgi:hypothetical protein